MQRAELWGTKLQEASLTIANLEGANLYRADLTRANLQGANFMAANLQEVDLMGAKLQQTKLRRADLTGVTNLKREQIESADVDSTTVLPNNLTIPEKWRQSE